MTSRSKIERKRRNEEELNKRSKESETGWVNSKQRCWAPDRSEGPPATVWFTIVDLGAPGPVYYSWHPRSSVIGFRDGGKWGTLEGCSEHKGGVQETFTIRCSCHCSCNILHTSDCTQELPFYIYQLICTKNLSSFKPTCRKASVEPLLPPFNFK